MKSFEANRATRTCVALAAGLLGIAGAAQAQGTKIERPIQAQPFVKTAAPVLEKLPSEERGTVPAPSADVLGKGTRAPSALPFDRTKTYWSTGADGTDWVRGTKFKAHFAADGMTMIPFLGSSEPVDHPATMRLERATSGGEPIALAGIVDPIRTGNHIVYARGLVDEVYDVEAGSIEQTFVVHGLPRAGGLELHVSTVTDLERRDGDDGIEFTNERGGLHCGRATVIDANGRRALAPGRVVADGIQIDVSAEFLATAKFPVVVDPVITVTIDADLDDDYRPDVAFDATTGRFMTVYEEAYSLTDHDVRYIVTDPQSTNVGAGYVDGSDVNWGNPRVANNNVANQFLAVAQVGVTGSRVIAGRTFGAIDMSPSLIHTLSGPEAVDAVLPELGGDPSTQPPSYYCLVYENIYSLLDHDILANLVDVGCNVHGATIPIDTSSGTLDQFPAISPSNGVALDFHDQRWTIVWERQYAPGDSDIYGRQLDWQGTLTTPTFAVDSGTGNDFLPAVSTQLDLPGTSRFAVVWQRRDATESDIRIKVMDATATINEGNVSQMENVAWGKDQILPTIDSNGSQFILAYSELYDPAGSDYDVFETVLYCSGTLIGLQDKHVALANTSWSEMRPEIVCCHSSGAAGPMYMVAFDVDAGTQNDVFGAYSWSPIGVTPYEFCFGTNATCPCGNGGAANNGCASSVNANGAHLAATGAGVTEDDTIVLSATGMPATGTSLFFQTTGWNGGAPFGDGIRCAGGPAVRLATKVNVAGAASFPSAGDQPVHVRGSVPNTGGWRYYQCWYRNAANFCTPSTFNLTNAVEVRWIP